jgi:hypothetical protein
MPLSEWIRKALRHVKTDAFPTHSVLDSDSVNARGFYGYDATQH